MQKETKAVLQAIDIASHLKATPMLSIEIQQNYDYFMAKEPAKHCSPLNLFPLWNSTN